MRRQVTFTPYTPPTPEQLADKQRDKRRNDGAAAEKRVSTKPTKPKEPKGPTKPKEPKEPTKPKEPKPRAKPTWTATDQQRLRLSMEHVVDVGNPRAWLIANVPPDAPCKHLHARAPNDCKASRNNRKPPQQPHLLTLLTASNVGGIDGDGAGDVIGDDGDDDDEDCGDDDDSDGGTLDLSSMSDVARAAVSKPNPERIQRNKEMKKPLAEALKSRLVLTRSVETGEPTIFDHGHIYALDWQLSRWWPYSTVVNVTGEPFLSSNIELLRAQFHDPREFPDPEDLIDYMQTTATSMFSYAFERLIAVGASVSLVSIL